MNVLSLFDGMSCGQIALERAGIKVENYYASEIDKYAIQVSQDNYPETIQVGDVIGLGKDSLPKIDFLIGGSPCQGFSFAGKQLNFDDPRSKLFFEYVRLLIELSPKYFLLENVRMKKEYQAVISKYLGVEPIKINSDLVSAQNRVRLYWTNIPNVHQPEDKRILLKDVLDNPIFVPGGLAIRRKSKTVRVGGRSSPPLSKQEWDNIFIKTIHHRCMKEKYAIWNGDGWRKLSVVECERLQTVPDNYTSIVSNAQRYKMLGNGWTVDVIAHIFKGLK